MKIAIPSMDGNSLSMHFGRSRGFIIYTIDNQTISGKEYRNNDFTGHAQGLHHEHNHDHDPSHQGHSHIGILNVLADCEIVIAGGMGQRLFSDLTQAGKSIYITSETNPETAVKLFLENKLDSNPEKCCSH